MKVRPSLPGVLSLVPLAGFVWLMFYAYVAYRQGGYWPPVYGRPDPTNIRPWLTGYILMGVLMAFLLASPISLVAVVWISSRREWMVLLKHLSVFALGAVLFATQLMRLKEWLVD
jgi:hypothetical protein